MKLIQSFLGFKQKKSPILQHRNSILRLLLIINIPSILLIVLFNYIVPQPYMDEQFHFHQFSQYYQDNYQYWNQKLTTPPGLYYVQRIFSFVFGNSLCMTRCLNCLFFGNISAVFLLKIYDFVDPNPNNISRALNLVLTPTIFFFNFLDYTDSSSLSMVVMMFYYNLIGSQWRLAITSIIAITIRQNNIVWIGYLIGYKILGEAKKVVNKPQSFFGNIFSIIKMMATNKITLLKQCKFQLAIIISFLLYMKIFNQGHLTFGDHKNHIPTFHPTQILYLSLFILLNLPITMGQFFASVKYFYQRIYISRHELGAYLLGVSFCIVVIDKWSYVHRFIVDDNRHYSFYLYRYFFKISLLRYALAFIYSFAFNIIFKLIVNSKLKLFKFILWIITSAAYLCMGELVQFRYFALPFILLCFEIENKNFKIDVEGIHQESRITAIEKMVWTNIVKVMVNIVIFGIFLGREFSNEYGKGRIMW